MKIEILIIYISLALSLPPLLILFLRDVKSNCTLSVKAVKPFVWLTFIGSIYEVVFTIILSVITAYWFMLYALLEFIVMYYFFNTLLRDKFIYWRKVYLICYVTVWFVYLFFWDTDTHLRSDSYFFLAETLFVYIASIFWFRGLVDREKTDLLRNNPAFYFVCGLVLYFSGSMVMFLLIYDMYIDKPSMIFKYWAMTIVFSIIMRVLVSIGVWKATKTKNLFVKVR